VQSALPRTATLSRTEDVMTAPAPEPNPRPEPFPEPLPKPPGADDQPVKIIELPPNQPSPGVPVDNPVS
jgi:hypothetical protein